MLQITPQHHLMLAVQPIDFRRGIDGLMSVCRQHLKHDPFSGTFFIFTNKRRTAVKILIYDGQGFWLIIRRFSLGKLAWWPTEKTTTHKLTATELQILLAQGMPHAACIPEDWRPLKPLVAEAACSVLPALGNSRASTAQDP